MYIVILKVGGVYMFLEFFYFEILLNLIFEDVEFVVIIMSEYLKDKFFNLVDLILLSEGWDERFEMENVLKFVLEKLILKFDDLVYIVYFLGIIGKLKGM